MVCLRRRGKCVREGDVGIVLAADAASYCCMVAACSPHETQLQEGDGPTAMQLDAYVDVERLAEAMSELDKYIEAARAQLFEIRKKKAGGALFCAAVLVCVCVSVCVCM